MPRATLPVTSSSTKTSQKQSCEKGTALTDIYSYKAYRLGWRLPRSAPWFCGVMVVPVLVGSVPRTALGFVRNGGSCESFPFWDQKSVL